MLVVFLTSERDVSSVVFDKFCILMIHNHDVIGLQQNRTYIQHASLVSTTLATEQAWHCGMSNT